MNSNYKNKAPDEGALFGFSTINVQSYFSW